MNFIMNNKFSTFIIIIYIITISYQLIIIKSILISKSKRILLNCSIILLSSNCFLSEVFGKDVKQDTISCRDISIKDLKQIGQGGTGIVYSGIMMNTYNPLAAATNSLNEVIVKMSRSTTQKSINHECDILNILEKANVPNIEHCLCNSNYEIEKDDIRSISILEPYFSIKDKNNNDVVVSTIEAIPIKTIQLKAIDNLLYALVRIIENNIALSDVQLLIDSTSGKLIFIDFTESILISQPLNPSYNEIQLIISFIQECLAFIPSEYQLESINKLHEIISQSSLVKNNYINNLLNNF